MDLSKALQADGVVLAGELRPESTEELPDLSTLKIVGPVGRWTEYDWDDAFDRAVEDFEIVSRKPCLKQS